MKKLFLISLFVCVGILQSFADGFYYTDERGVTWGCADDPNSTTVSICDASGYGDEVVIPEKVYDGTKEYTVTKIAFTFNDIKTLEKVTWPSTVTKIPYQMFYGCSSLKAVENVRKVTSISSCAFKNCNNLIELDLGSCEIGESAFESCSKLQSIGESAKCTSVGNSAFYNCSSLAKVDLSMCTSVGSGSFNGCSSLQTVGNPKLTSIPFKAFYYCSSLEKIDLSMCTSVGSDAFHGCSSITEVDLSACKSLGDYVFAGCEKLENVIGLENFKSIPSYAFSGTALKTVYLPVCRTIGEAAFDGCSSLQFVDLPVCVSIDDGNRYGTGAFKGCTSLTSLKLPQCTNIGSRAFMGCSSLTDVDLLACKNLGPEAFSNCTKLENVIGLEKFKSIPSSAFSHTALKSVDLPVCTTIGASAFSGCSSLQSVDLPVCTTIGASAFNGCSGLQSVDLPKVESISNNALWKTNISKVSLPATLKSMGYQCFGKVVEYTFNGTQPAVLAEELNTIPSYNHPAFDGVPFIIRVPESAIDTYKTADVWKNYADKIFSIGDQLDYDVKTTAMDSQSGLEQIIGATNMKKVVSLKATGTINGYDIFMIRTKMANLQNLDLTDADIVANGFAYYENNSTTDNVVGDYSFYKSNNLVTLKLPKNAITIGDHAVASCSSLESVDFPKNLKNIKNESFYGCI